MMYRNKVLIIDDRIVVRETLRNVLLDFDCVFSEASTGIQALDLIRNDAFDLIFLDLRLPDCSGIDVLREARKLSKPLGKVITLTGFPEHGTQAEAESLGIFKYLTKPIDWNELRSAFVEAIRK